MACIKEIIRQFHSGVLEEFNTQAQRYKANHPRTEKNPYSNDKLFEQFAKSASGENKAISESENTKNNYKGNVVRHPNSSVGSDIKKSVKI